MPSFQDSAIIFLLALLLFGPKQLPKLARELGKWMGEFRRASNEFKMQMEEELRLSEQAERQQKLAAIEASAPATPALDTLPAEATDTPQFPAIETLENIVPQPSPIATSGDLNIMPPSTGLPTPQTSIHEDISPLLESIPEVTPAHHTAEKESSESAAHVN